MAYTIKDIAAEVGVSITTVSLVLNQKPCRVSDASRKRIMEVAEKHHYMPNWSARSLVMHESRTLGLIIPDLSNPCYSEIVKGVEMCAQKRGYSVIFCNSNESGRKDVENLRLLIGQQVDAVIVVSSLPVLILMTALMKGSMTVVFMALVLALFAWAWPSRQIRSMALTLKERDFIQTAWFSGEGTLQTVVTEILPFAFTWSLSNFMNATLSAIASESSLAVLGLSPANLITLGNMIQWARDFNAIMARRWLWFASPVVATVLLFVGLFMLITGYNDYLAMKRGR